MLRPLSPASLHPPFARYSHGIEVPVGARLVFASGQLGVDAAGAVPDGVEAQAALCFEAIRVILAEARMTLADIVRVNAFVTDRAHLQGYMAARDRALAPHQPASTLMIVTGFARPAFVVEVEAVAARLDDDA